MSIQLHTDTPPANNGKPLQQQVSAEFTQRFGAAPTTIVRAPGRVNLIGEHTDYNDGFVLPMAIDRAMWIALRPRPDRCVSAYSLDMRESVEFDLDHFEKQSGWGEYLKGVAWALIEAGFDVRGWEGVVAGDVPIGAGLSSSAAWELAAARAFAAVSGFAWDAPAMARLGQRAENKWVGVNCGIMDQMISATGQADHAVLIDCRSLELQIVPLPAETVVVVLDTATRRGLVDSAYNERRSQCEAAARFFDVKALRDVSVEQFNARADELDSITRRRARHVVTEDDRALRAVEAMRRGDAVELGQLMNACHVSLRDDFEVSSTELNVMVEAAQRRQECYGARMTGAGFGGCAVALVRADAARDFVHGVSTDYQAVTGRMPNIYVCRATNGAEIVEAA
ncbi:MAG: galactokinase [Chloroflexi bacterium]|nr:galactokinase [Chloroflexota bacterium]